MMEWAQHYAFTNREFMMDAAMADLGTLVAGLREEERTNCHHNFAARETHFGREVWLTRKGAIKADKGDVGIIPGSMGASTYITSGLGNPESYMSSAHGAGRQYSRKAARRTFTVESLNEQMAGKAWKQQARQGSAGRAPGRLQADRPGYGGPEGPDPCCPHPAPDRQLQRDIANPEAFCWTGVSRPQPLSGV